MEDHVSFDPSPELARAMGSEVIERLATFIAELEHSPASDMEGAYDLAESLRRPPPEEGEGFKALVDTVMEAASKSFNTAGPGYLAYIPGGGLYAAALADLIACVTNRFTNLSAPAPALVQLEANVVRWLCDEFDLPPGSQGVLTSGGSMANFTAIVAARSDRLPEDFLRGTIYVGEHVHHSISKGAKIAGFPERNLRPVPSDDRLRMDLDELRRMIADDRSSGAIPFMIVGSAGTIDNGAVDPLGALADIARDERLWLHVDGAYGGFFRLTERGRRALHGIERADSISLDPHKGLFLPYGTGSLLVRDGEVLKRAHQVEAAYLPASSKDAALPDFADYTVELSRDFRGLRVWLPLHLHGVAAFRRALAEKLELTDLLYERLKQNQMLEVPWEPQLSTVAFRPRGGTDEDARALLERINATKRVYLSSTGIAGHVYLRACILSHRTDRARIEEAAEIIAEASGT
jgi:aromatic-L-amino-acid/L-tryptophan decarboxylase